MAADCEQTRARMLELVYDELPAEPRAQLDAHVAGCEACRAELSALRSTRALARRSLAADAPPARARAAILRAAAAAVPARAPAPAVPAAAPAGPSFWDRLRAKWTLPTFATIGAVAVFLLASRIFLEPEKTYERGRQGLAPAEPAATPPVAPGDNPPAVSPTPSEMAGGAEVPRQAGPAAKSVPAARKRRAIPTGRSARAKGEEAEQAEPAETAPATEFAPPPPGEAAARAEPPRAFAPPPPAAPAAQPAARAAAPRPFAPAPAAAKPLERMAEKKSDTRGPARAEMDAPSADDEDRAAPRSGVAAPAPAGSSAGSAGGGAFLAERADRLFKERHWREAAIAYRQLLRDDPDNVFAPQWRKRLATCERAADGR